MSRGETADWLEKTIKGRPNNDALTDRERETVRASAPEAREMVAFLEGVTADARSMATGMEGATTVGDVRKLLGIADQLATKLDRV